MDFFEQTANKAKEVFDIVGKKTGEIVDLQKLKVSRSSILAKMSKEYEALGRIVYDNIKNGIDADSGTEERVANIDARINDLTLVDAKIAASKGTRICPTCSSPNDEDAVFCNKCAQKLIFESESEEE